MILQNQNSCRFSGFPGVRQFFRQYHNISTTPSPLNLFPLPLSASHHLLQSFSPTHQGSLAGITITLTQHLLNNEVAYAIKTHLINDHVHIKCLDSECIVVTNYLKTHRRRTHKRYSCYWSIFCLIFVSKKLIKTNKSIISGFSFMLYLNSDIICLRK